MKSGKIVITLGGIGLALFLSWAFVSFMTKEKPLVDTVSKLATTGLVKVIAVANGEVPIIVKSEGRVYNASMVHLISEVKGEIVGGKHALKQGTSFKKGELIFSVSNPEGLYALKAARSAFIQLLTTLLPDLKTDFKKGFGKWETYFSVVNANSNLPSLPQIEDDREHLFLSNRSLFKAYYEVKAREAQFQKHYFHAPFDGVLMNVVIQEGTQLNPGMNVGTFGKTSEKEIEVSLTTAQIGQLKVGNKAIIHKTGTSQELAGTVSRVSDFLNPATQSFSCYIKIKDQQAIKHGEYYQVKIDAGIIKNAQQLSIEAIYGESDVQVYQRDSTLVKKTVNLVYYDDEIAVVQGLADSTKVVNQKVPLFEGRKYKALD